MPKTARASVDVFVVSGTLGLEKSQRFFPAVIDPANPIWMENLTAPSIAIIT